MVPLSPCDTCFSILLNGKKTSTGLLVIIFTLIHHIFIHIPINTSFFPCVNITKEGILNIFGFMPVVLRSLMAFSFFCWTSVWNVILILSKTRNGVHYCPIHNPTPKSLHYLCIVSPQSLFHSSVAGKIMLFIREKHAWKIIYLSEFFSLVSLKRGRVIDLSISHAILVHFKIFSSKNA